MHLPRALAALAAAALLTSCRSPAPPVAAPRPAPSYPAPQVLVPWHGPVEGVFVHPLVLDPAEAFTDDALGRGFRDYFITRREFAGLLDGLWRNGWTLVDAHRAATGQVLVPPGRKPVVLSEDDVDYYRYFAGHGLARRLVLDGDRVRAEVGDDGRTSLTDDDVVPMVEAAVEAHPDLSAGGARGVLAETGYDGLLGEHDAGHDADADARVKALAARLVATGWLFASHTYGHIDLSRAGRTTIERDTARWHALADPLLGPVDLLVYPFGSRPSAAGARRLRDLGFPVQFDIDVRPGRTERDGVVVLSRRHVDGLALEGRRLAPFLDAAAVRDPARDR